MQERPIAVLVGALRQLGARITYLKNEGFPPLEFGGLVATGTGGAGDMEIRGDISSQYISALLMLSPYQPDGLRLRLTGSVGSRPYIDMTLALMRLFGADCVVEGDTIRVGANAVPPHRLHGRVGLVGRQLLVLAGGAGAGRLGNYPAGLARAVAARRPGHCRHNGTFRGANHVSTRWPSPPAGTAFG
jgi:hypothetical protein